eukprot:Gb_25236 [translate_table: standard]
MIELLQRRSISSDTPQRQWRFTELGKEEQVVLPVIGEDLNMLSLAKSPFFNSEKYIQRIRCFSSGIPTEARRLQGKVAIITGAANGIGEATAKLFVAHGAKVVIADIEDELGGRVSAALHPNAHFFHCNVAQEKDVSDAVDFALRKYGHLDIMFNNAGIGGSFPPTPADASMEDFRNVMAANVEGVLSGVKHAARAMIPANNGGSILCTASIASIVALRGATAYTISKHAVVGIAKSAASDLAPYGIRVNCVSPYGLATKLPVHAIRKLMPDITTETVARGFQNCTDFKGATLVVDDIARAALFLSSDDARYISGHNLVIDGAFTSSKELNPLKV